MKSHTPAGCIPATTARKTTRLSDNRHEARATETIELDSKDFSEHLKSLILTRMGEWQCSPGDAVVRLLDEIVAKQPAPASPRYRVTLELDRGLCEEVSELLRSPDGITIFGVAPLEERFRVIAASWLRDMTHAFAQGSGYRAAAGLPPVEKGGRL